MKTITHNLHKLMTTRTLIATLAVALAGSVGAQTAVRYVSQPGISVKIDGTSNIHDWTVEGKIIKGFMEADADYPASAAKPDASIPKPKVEVSIPVRSLKSGNTVMDKVMQEAMTMAKYPNIDYKLLELKPKADSPATGALKFDAVGALTVSGVTRTNVMPVTIERTDKAIKVKGSTKMKMTQFGIKPPAPALALGLIKTGDDVTVSIDWLTAPEAPAAK